MFLLFSELNGKQWKLCPDNGFMDLKYAAFVFPTIYSFDLPKSLW